jgi:hypothetical protein
MRCIRAVQMSGEEVNEFSVQCSAVQRSREKGECDEQAVVVFRTEE